MIVGPILGALPGSVAALWGLGALTTFGVGVATLALEGIFDIVGIGLAILLVVIAGNPSAGGAFPAPMLPPFWAAIGPALPGCRHLDGPFDRVLQRQRRDRSPAGAVGLGSRRQRGHAADGAAPPGTAPRLIRSGEPGTGTRKSRP